jgi:hypothetical protein
MVDANAGARFSDHNHPNQVVKTKQWRDPKWRAFCASDEGRTPADTGVSMDFHEVIPIFPRKL